MASINTSAVAYTKAVLEATINPQGEQTTFHFEYGPADCSANSCESFPVPDANVGAGSSPVTLTKELGGLQPGTQYHFRVVATNTSGTTPSADRTFTTYEVPVPQSGCPNQEFLIGPSALLPSCRAFEMVSPIDKNGAGLETNCEASCYRTAWNQISLDGNKVAFSSFKAFGDAVSSPYASQYLATRTADGWSTHGISPPLYGNPSEIRGLGQAFQAFTPDLSMAWAGIENLQDQTSTGFFARRNNITDTFEMISPTFWEVEGFTNDGDLVAITSRTDLTPNAHPAAIQESYVVSDGAIHLVSVLPDGTVSPEESTIGYKANWNSDGREASLKNAVSTDGSRVFWTGGGVDGRGPLYVRVNPDQPQSAIESGQCTEPSLACTIQISASDSHFWAASSDGSKVLYGVNAFSHEDLFLYDLETEVLRPIGTEVMGVMGASEDLSAIYFVSQQDYAPGATAGEANLYLDDAGKVSYITTLLKGEAGQNTGEVVGYNSVSSNPIDNPSRVSWDGNFAVFQSMKSLTGYDNADARNGKPDVEVYRYSAPEDRLICVSCNPSEARPQGQPLQIAFKTGTWPVNNNGGPERRWTAAWLPHALTSFNRPRSLSDDGNYVFFNAFDALLPDDTNNEQDVYQWRAGGVDGCENIDGCISLISTADSAQKSEFVDATPDGRNLLIETSSSIHPLDPAFIDIYNARIGGGFPLPAPAAPCEGDACQGTPSPPNRASLSSYSYSGPGNLPVTKKKVNKKKRHKKKRHGKHTKRHGKKKQNGSKQRQHAHRATRTRG